MTAQHTIPPGFRRDGIDVVVIGGSAGSIDALLELLPALPARPGFAVVAVVHLPEGRESLLSEVFTKRCAIEVREPQDKAPVQADVLYFAPAGYHLLIEADHTFALSCDPPVRFSRPSIDVLISSAADACGPALAAILLTGANEDGARGMAQAAAAGALTVVQAPDDAQVPDMPAAALARMSPDFILPLSQMHGLLAGLRPLP
jgi:two-component system chemotaxis response regulator CheB